MSADGIGAMSAYGGLVRQVGLIDRIDEELHVLKRPLPCHESDHVLNLAFNILCGGTCPQDLELRRNDASPQRRGLLGRVGRQAYSRLHDRVRLLSAVCGRPPCGGWRR